MEPPKRKAIQKGKGCWDPEHELKAQKNTVYSSIPFSLKSNVFQLLDQDPLLKAKKICKLLDYDYKTYGAQVSARRFEWLHSEKIHPFGLGSKCSNYPDSQNHVRATCRVPECLDRRKYPDVLPLAIKAGWRQNANRNRALVWRNDQNSLGRIEWFENGTVSISVRSPINMGRARTLAGKAFGDTVLIANSRILIAFQESIRWGGAHDVYETKERLPYKKIETYVEPYNLVIKTGDRSHPNAIEVEWARIPGLERLENRLNSIEVLQEKQLQFDEKQIQLQERQLQAVEKNTEALESAPGKSGQPPKNIGVV